jgi:hypothetical protein
LGKQGRDPRDGNVPGPVEIEDEERREKVSSGEQKAGENAETLVPDAC